MKIIDISDEFDLIKMHQQIIDAKSREQIEEMHFTIHYYIHKNEFELLLRLACFSKWQVYGKFNYEPLKIKGAKVGMGCGEMIC